MIFEKFLSVVKILLCIRISLAQQPPNIIFILADDLGWNDVGFHGSSQIPTPNLDALAYSGIIMNNYYVTPVCTPTRSALMTGKYPIHTGMQHAVLYGMEPRGLPLNETLFPQYLKKMGYSNHIVGKWHLGHWKKEYTPLYRGFDSHIGYWTGHQDYYDHTAAETNTWGLDMRRNMSVAFDLHGKYTTDVIDSESVKIIKNHDKSRPLFLYVAHVAVHSGNDYDPLRAPDEKVAKFENIKDFKRKKFTAMMSKLDDSVGNLVAELKRRNMLQNTIIVFSTDNGGPAEGFNSNAASNWPLRGVKNTLWEGGVRGAAFLWSPLLKNRNRIATQLFHVTDWMPTLIAAAGGDSSKLGQIDGINQWTELSEDKSSNRKEVLHNIDHIYGDASLMIYPWKIVNGTVYNGQWDGWYGPSGDRSSTSYSIVNVQTSKAGSALIDLNMLPSPQQIKNLREDGNIICDLEDDSETICKPNIEPCLFNIKRDPCEKRNLAKKYPKILETLTDCLWNKYDKSAVPPGNKKLDPNGDPKNHNYIWTNFGDL